jgi:hypothetical protein
METFMAILVTTGRVITHLKGLQYACKQAYNIYSKIFSGHNGTDGHEL